MMAVQCELPPVTGALRRLRRMPLAGQQVPIVGAFLCSYLLYGQISGTPSSAGWHLLAGLGSFIVLFAQLRFIDDLDDLERDHPPGSCGAARGSSLRARLVVGLGACLIITILLNLENRHALMAALAATALAYMAPFGFKRCFPRSVMASFPAFEGAPALIFAYVYFFWRDAGGSELSPAAVLGVTGLFWAGYEFWKFSRKAHTEALQPYLLSPRGIRVALNGFLVLALVASLTLGQMAGLSVVFRVWATVLVVGWLVWLNLRWSRPRSASALAPPMWAGMSLVAVLEVILLIELLMPRVWS